MATAEQDTEAKVSETDVEAAIAAYEAEVQQSASTSVTEALAMRSLLRKFSFTRIDESVEPAKERVDNEAIKGAIYTILPDHVVTDAADYETAPLHRHKLAGKLLVGHPVPRTDEWDALDAMGRAAWNKAEQHIFKQVGDAYGDTLQRWVRERLGNGLVLVKEGETVFLTAQPKYIRSGIFQPKQDKLEVAAAALGEQYALFGKQCPALKVGAQATLKSGMKRVGEKAQAAYTLRDNVADAGDDTGE